MPLALRLADEPPVRSLWVMLACLPGWRALLIATPVLDALAALHALDGRRISACGDPTAWLRMQSDSNWSQHPNSLRTGNLTGKFQKSGAE